MPFFSLVSFPFDVIIETHDCLRTLFQCCFSAELLLSRKHAKLMIVFLCINFNRLAGSSGDRRKTVYDKWYAILGNAVNS
jgi:hypothetical protein